MLRTSWFKSASAAKQYFRVSDYHASTPGTWMGKGAERLGLQGIADVEDFDRLCDNLDPRTGGSLTERTVANRRVGMDFTFNSSKSIGIARELAGKGNLGDPRIEDAHREAVAYAMAELEKDVQVRVRSGGQNGNRTTGELVAYRVTHRDTRVNIDDQRPDMSLHDHVFVLNASYDPVEKKWKAAELAQVKHDAPFFEAVYHNRLASNLRGLGYGVRRKDGRAFEIEGVSDDLILRFSRRTAHINAVADRLGITRPESKARLGATTRLGKAKETEADLHAYFVSRLTDSERKRLAGLEGQDSYESTPERSVRYALEHLFERQSVVGEKRVYETALRHGVGSVSLDAVRKEARRQGLLVKDGEATTKIVLEQEQRIIVFARDGKGAVRPLRAGGFAPGDDSATLSPEQGAVIDHVLTSPDKLILIRGAAGVGKTHALKHALARIDAPVALLAPSAEASRGVLRRDGLDADTVAAFLGDTDRHAKVRGGVIVVDEAGMLPIRDLDMLCDIASEQKARIVLQGDPKQHKSIPRWGNVFRTLQTHAGLPVAELKEIRRQSGRYREAVAAIADGDIVKGHDILDALGCIRRAEGNAALVDDYMVAVAKGKDILVVCPTHAQGDEITRELRARLKAEGRIGKDEKEFLRLRPTNWTDAQKGDYLHAYQGDEVIQVFRNSGPLKAGGRYGVPDLVAARGRAQPKHFAVYDRGSIRIAAGDAVRITAGAKVAGRRLDNGSRYTVTGVSEEGIALSNGLVLPADFGHISHDNVSTSFTAQGTTRDLVLIAMGSESLPAIGAEQFYVSVSRGRESARIYTDLEPEKLREAIKRPDARKSATELMGSPQGVRWKAMQLARRIRDRYRALRERHHAQSKHPERERHAYGR